MQSNPIRPLWSHDRLTTLIVTTPCILSQYDEFIMVTSQSDKFQCTIPRFLTANSFLSKSEW